MLPCDHLCVIAFLAPRRTASKRVQKLLRELPERVREEVGEAPLATAHVGLLKRKPDGAPPSLRLRGSRAYAAVGIYVIIVPERELPKLLSTVRSILYRSALIESALLILGRGLYEEE